MYFGKEKLTLAHRLVSEADAEKDLCLLEEKSPSLESLPRFRRFPSKCAGEILYALLDVATESEILQNRKGTEDTPEETGQEDQADDVLRGMFNEPLLDTSETTQVGTEPNTETEVDTPSDSPADDGAEPDTETEVDAPSDSPTDDDAKKNDPSPKSENTPA